MTITIEPMVNAGRRHVKLLPRRLDGRHQDHSLSAQWEHTLLVTTDGCEVLTLGARAAMSAPAAGVVSEPSPTEAALDADLARGGPPLRNLQTRTQRRSARPSKRDSPRASRSKRSSRARAALLDAILVRLAAARGELRGRLQPRSPSAATAAASCTPHRTFDLMVLRPDAAGSALGGRRRAPSVSFPLGHGARSRSQRAHRRGLQSRGASRSHRRHEPDGIRACWPDRRRSTHACDEATSPARRVAVAGVLRGAKLREQQERHHRFDDTAYNLEPNVKSGPGRAARHSAHRLGRRSGISGRARSRSSASYGFLTAEAVRESAGRTRLPVAGALRPASCSRGAARTDSLFDTQVKLARMFGYEDASYTLAVEQFMQRYYRTVMELQPPQSRCCCSSCAKRSLTPAPEAPMLINERFQVRHGYLETRRDDVFRQQPAALLELFLIVQEHGKLRGVERTHNPAHPRRAPDCRRGVPQQNPRHHRMFLSLLRAPAGVTHALRRMNLYGILGLLHPRLRPHRRAQCSTTCSTPTRSTRHILFVVSHLRRFTVRAPRRHSCPQLQRGSCSGPPEARAGVPSPRCFTTSPRGRGGDRSELGSVDAEAFCLEQGLGRYDARLVAWLREQPSAALGHRAEEGTSRIPRWSPNSRVRPSATRRTSTISTCSPSPDVRATNPKLVELLEGVALRGALQRTRSGHCGAASRIPIDREELIAEQQAQARALLRCALGSTMRPSTTRCGSSTEDYFLRHAPEEIAWHAAACSRSRRSRHARARWSRSARQTERRGGTSSVHLTRRMRRTTSRSSPQCWTSSASLILDARHHRRRERLQPRYLRRAGSERRAHSRACPHGGDREQPAIAHCSRERTRASRGARRARCGCSPRSRASTSSPDPSNERTVLELSAGDRPGLLCDVGQLPSARRASRSTTCEDHDRRRARGRRVLHHR